MKRGILYTTIIAMFLISNSCTFASGMYDKFSNPTDGDGYYTADSTVQNSYNIYAQRSSDASTTSSLLEKYKKENLKISEDYSNVPKSISTLEITSMRASQNDGVAASFDVAIEEDIVVTGRTVLPWYNDSYLVWNKALGYEGMYFASEFDKDKNYRGLVIIVAPENSENFFRCYEYLDNSGIHEAPQKTILITYNDNHKAVFLYDANMNLLAYKIDKESKILNNSIVTNSKFLSEISKMLH